MRRSALAVAVLAAMAVTAAPALGGNGQQAVKTGSYIAAPDIGHGTYAQGGWDVIREDGKRKMVASPQYTGIYYPDAGKCDPYSLPLAATSIKISKKGRFHIKEDTPVTTPQGTKTVHVDWAGHWTSSRKLKGTIKLGFKKCTDKRGFTGHYGS